MVLFVFRHYKISKYFVTMLIFRDIISKKITHKLLQTPAKDAPREARPLEKNHACQFAVQAGRNCGHHIGGEPCFRLNHCRVLTGPTTCLSTLSTAFSMIRNLRWRIADVISTLSSLSLRPISRNYTG